MKDDYSGAKACTIKRVRIGWKHRLIGKCSLQKAGINYLDGQRTGPGGTFIGGNGSIDASGLSINDPSYDPALAMVHSQLLAWNPGPANGLVSDVGGPVFGGTDMKDVKTMSSTSPGSYDPWNVFVQGNVVLAQGFSQIIYFVTIHPTSRLSNEDV